MQSCITFLWEVVTQFETCRAPKSVTSDGSINNTSHQRCESVADIIKGIINQTKTAEVKRVPPSYKLKKFGYMQHVVLTSMQRRRRRIRQF